MRYQSLEINYHTAPNNKSTALPILQKLISIMVCLLGRAEYRDLGSASLAAARPPGPWRQYPSSPEGWGVKTQSLLASMPCSHRSHMIVLVTRWRPVLYFPDTEFHTFFSGQVPISSDIHVVQTFPDMSGARPSCRSWPDCSLRPFP